MPELKKSEWIKPETLKNMPKNNHNEVVGFIKGIPDYQVNRFDENQENLVGNVEFKDGSIFKFNINKTNRDELAKCYGTNTDVWDGKPIYMQIGKQLYKGKTVDSVFVRGDMP